MSASIQSKIIDDLERHVQAQHDALCHLLHLTHKEREAIVCSDLEELSSIRSQKELIVHTSQIISQKIHEIITGINSTEIKTVTDFIQLLDKEDGLLINDLIGQIEDISIRLKARSDQNSELLKFSIMITSSVRRNMLKSINPKSVYGRDGQMSLDDGLQRTIVSGV